ncbi:MAG: hypothetical protein ACI94Z_000725 [Yoonia sp.]|jgi:hypothetical protein
MPYALFLKTIRATIMPQVLIGFLQLRITVS